MMASLHGQLWRKRRAGEAAESSENGRRGQRRTNEPRARNTRSSRQSREGPRKGLEIQIQVGREIRHGPAGAYLPCAATPDFQGDAGVQPVKDDLGRGDVAFARDGFTERAQNGQRVDDKQHHPKGKTEDSTSSPQEEEGDRQHHPQGESEEGSPTRTTKEDEREGGGRGRCLFYLHGL